MNDENAGKMLENARKKFRSGVTRSYGYRMRQILAIKAMVEENAGAIRKALKDDLGKSKVEVDMSEIALVVNELENIITNLKKWMNPESTKKAVANILDSSIIYNDPYGVVLVIGAWNYPIQLTMIPFSAAVAAGNCVILKPSEISDSVAKLLYDLIPRYLDNDCYYVYLGGVGETEILLKQRFDYIFFTGSAIVGQVVHRAANKHLTPVTLELGGKCPVYLDDDAPIEMAVQRILWGKLINAGQSCVAPDYLLCTRSTQDKFVKAARKIINEWYGSDIKKSADFGRIVNKKHFQRVVSLLDNCNIAIGGNYDEANKYIEPTIVVDVTGEEKIMQEEIFGPILPIVNVRDLNEAIDFINKREKSLAIYIFSKSKNKIDEMIAKTSSGGITVNDTILHMTTTTLPFGGVGKSGMGSYHGKFGFDTFSHKRACLSLSVTAVEDFFLSYRYPPYSDKNLKVLLALWSLRIPDFSWQTKYLLIFLVGVMSSFWFDNFLELFKARLKK